MTGVEKNEKESICKEQKTYLSEYYLVKLSYICIYIGIYVYVYFDVK